MSQPPAPLVRGGCGGAAAAAAADAAAAAAAAVAEHLARCGIDDGAGPAADAEAARWLSAAQRSSDEGGSGSDDDGGSGPASIGGGSGSVSAAAAAAAAYADKRDRTCFFAKVSPSAAPEEVAAVFSPHGGVDEVNLFRAWATARSSKGCGLIVMASPAAAAAARDALNGKHTWEGADGPMVVEWCRPDRLGAKSAAAAASKAAAALARAAAAPAAERGGGRRRGRGGGAGGEAGGGADGAAPAAGGAEPLPAAAQPQREPAKPWAAAAAAGGGGPAAAAMAAAGAAARRQAAFPPHLGLALPAVPAGGWPYQQQVYQALGPTGSQLAPATPPASAAPFAQAQAFAALPRDFFGRLACTSSDGGFANCEVFPFVPGDPSAAAMLGATAAPPPPPGPASAAAPGPASAAAAAALGGAPSHGGSVFSQTLSNGASGYCSGYSSGSLAGAPPAAPSSAFPPSTSQPPPPSAAAAAAAAPHARARGAAAMGTQCLEPACGAMAGLWLGQGGEPWFAPESEALMQPSLSAPQGFYDFAQPPQWAQLQPRWASEELAGAATGARHLAAGAGAGGAAAAAAAAQQYGFGTAWPPPIPAAFCDPAPPPPPPPPLAAPQPQPQPRRPQVSLPLHAQQAAAMQAHMVTLAAVTGCAIHLRAAARPDAGAAFELVLAGSPPQLQSASLMVSRLLQAFGCHA
ncbi:RNA-binding protein [Raphidocelis subcapitata]|uniref:RNA-binding protein n=1 Tax=Raphidocelis subcapitata TaxID=307507 RepID=A0A2V0NV19_9CHLO|nr:RNA-binding protein [Raphidocelis subcapitata]|eukprot:GBF89403.1 RNA-binding protein [Raphidocelis subcapitata]